MTDSRQKWNQRYQAEVLHYPEAARVLRQNQHLLPPCGTALDLACGLGANALMMAEHGLNTHAWDVSEQALTKLAAEAELRQLQLIIEQRDVVTEPPQPNSFDVIVVSQFLQRSLCPQLLNALKPDGLLFYQTFCRTKIDDSGPGNPDFLLDDNELLSLFGCLRLRVYREESLLGDHSHGWRNMAMLIGQKC